MLRMNDIQVSVANGDTSAVQLERMRAIVNDRYERDEGALWRMPNRDRAPRPLEAFYAAGTRNSLLVAHMGERIVGTLLLQRGNRDDAPVKTFEFGMLAVEHEGRGHAKALIAYAEALAAHEGALAMELCVWKPQSTVMACKERLVAMYTHLGYAVVDVAALEVVNSVVAADTAAPVQVVRMRKSLARTPQPPHGL